MLRGFRQAGTISVMGGDTELIAAKAVAVGGAGRSTGVNVPRGVFSPLVEGEGGLNTMLVRAAAAYLRVAVAGGKAGAVGGLPL